MSAHEQIAIDDFLSRKLRDEGIKRAADHADKEIPGWQARAFVLFLEFLRVSGLREFTGENVRIFAESRGLPDPPDKRAWGAVMVRAAKIGHIVKIGWTTASDPKVHKNPISLWRRT